MSSSVAIADRQSRPASTLLDLTIGERLAMGFGVVLFIVAAFIGVVIAWHSQSAEAQRNYHSRIQPLTASALALERATLFVGTSLRAYLVAPTPERLDAYKKYALEADRALSALADLPKEADGHAMFDDIWASTRQYHDQANSLATQRTHGDRTLAEEAELIRMREVSLDYIHRFIELQQRKTDTALDRMAAARDKVSGGLIVLSIIGAVLFLCVAYYTTQSIRRPTKDLVNIASALEHGDWQPALSLVSTEATGSSGGRSEMLRLARAIGSAAVVLEQRERELREKNERIEAQNAELQVQAEELQAQSEELQIQSEELQAQSEELQAQNEELNQQGIELRAHSDALADANERKNHFLGLLAHELRNPLAPISNSVFLLKRVPPGSEQALRAQAVIERQTRHMIRLVDDLLDITRIEQGKIRVQHEKLDVASILRACLDDQHGALEQHRLHVTLDLPVEPVHVRGDPTRLSQVFGNLLSNAIKFTNEGGNISVRLNTDNEGGHAVLRVADDGIGMDASLLPMLFQPFSQGANGAARTQGGLGLGLALVKALVELHGGSITAHSAGANRGSEFVIRLPLVN